MKRCYRPYLWPAYRALLQRSDRPILVGPWHGEVGFEALYWLPWLTKLRTDLQIAPDRVIPITRGGVGVLYDAPTALELYAMRSPQDVRVANWLQFQQTGMMKQRHVTDFDRGILADAACTLGLSTYLTLHPAWMYQALSPFWTGQHGMAWLHQRASFPVLTPPVLQGVTLPEHFAAVRFYFRPTFPTSQASIMFAKATIQHLAQSHHVVILNSGLHVDDHLDYLPTDRTNVTVLSDVVPLTHENNLAVQAAVLGQAEGFVGTYGGMAQLALRMRKPVVSFYEEWHSTALAHRHLSDALALQMRIPFHVLRIGDLPMLQSIMPRAINSPQHVVATDEDQRAQAEVSA